MKILKIPNNVCGIYCLLNTSNGKKYIGLSRNVLKRVKEHTKLLKNKTHYNRYLQAAYIKAPFIAFLIQECNEKDLKECEVFWIKTSKTTDVSYGYNLTEGGEDLGALTLESKERKRLNRTGKSSSLKGQKQSKEWVEARMAKLRGQKRTYTPEHIAAIKEARSKKIGQRKKGKPVTITDNSTQQVTVFSSKREAEDFLGIARDKLIHKFYQGKPRRILKKITYLNYTIERT